MTCLLVELFERGRGKEHDLGHIGVVRVWGVVCELVDRRRLHKLLVHDCEGGGIADVEWSFNREGLAPDVVSLEEVRGNVEAVVALLQLHH